MLAAWMDALGYTRILLLSRPTRAPLLAVLEAPKSVTFRSSGLLRLS
jgi:hypothetical protein